MEKSRTIRADQLKRGDTVSNLIGRGGLVRKVDGRWPTVLSISVSGKPPTVHIETSDRPGQVHRLTRADAVTVLTRGT